MLLFIYSELGTISHKNCAQYKLSTKKLIYLQDSGNLILTQHQFIEPTHVVCTVQSKAATSWSLRVHPDAGAAALDLPTFHWATVSSP